MQEIETGDKIIVFNQTSLGKEIRVLFNRKRKYQ